MFATNNAHCAPIEKGDRRFFVTECDNCYTPSVNPDGSATYHDALRRQMTAAAGQAVTAWYMQQRLDPRMLHSAPPQTAIRTQMQQQSASTPLQFLEEVAANRMWAKDYKGVGSGKWEMAHGRSIQQEVISGPNLITRDCLYELYQDWCKREGEPKTFSNRIFSNIIKERISSTPKTLGGNSVRVYDIQDLLGDTAVHANQ
jgi:phage/plasmid-associated DNA primase